MAQFKEATLTTGEKIIVNVDEIRLMHWIQDATTIRFAKDHGVQIKETPEQLMIWFGIDWSGPIGQIYAPSQ